MGIGGRLTVGSGTPWEARVGYARAVRVGNLVFVSGTTATDATGAFVGGDAYAQAVRVFTNIDAALRGVGAERRHVVRTRMFVVNVDDWEAIGRAHAEFYGAIRPATSMVQVARLIDPGMLLEAEADAVID